MLPDMALQVLICLENCRSLGLTVFMSSLPQEMNASLPADNAKQMTLSVRPDRYRTYSLLCGSINRKKSVAREWRGSLRFFSRNSRLAINFGNRVGYFAGMLSEPDQVHTVFLAECWFGAFALFNVKDLDYLIVASSDQVVAPVVKGL